MSDQTTPSQWDQLFPGRFWRAGLLGGGRITLTIERVTIEDLPNDKGGETPRGIVIFSDHAMQLALNKTNGICLREMFGTYLPAWSGKRVTLFPSETRDPVTRKMIPCVRVWGSPDLERDMQVTISLPRRKPFPMTMHAVREERDGQDALPPAAEVLLHHYEECTTADGLAVLETERGRIWPQIGIDVQRRLKAASDEAKRRIAVAAEEQR